MLCFVCIDDSGGNGDNEKYDMFYYHNIPAFMRLNHMGSYTYYVSQIGGRWSIPKAYVGLCGGRGSQIQKCLHNI